MSCMYDTTGACDILILIVFIAVMLKNYIHVEVSVKCDAELSSVRDSWSRRN